MPPTIAQVRRYKTMRDSISRPARREFDRLARAVDLDSDDALEQLQTIARAVMRTYGKASAELGAQWFELCAPKKGAKISLSTGASDASLASNVGYNVERYKAGLIGRETAVRSMSAKAVECVITAAEETVFNGMTESIRAGYATKRDKYIRVASPDACAFCQMVASNEYTFGSAESAGFETHDGCRCVGVPYSGIDGVDGYDASVYERRYDDAQTTIYENNRGIEPYDDELQARIDAAKERHAKESDKPWTSTNEALVVMRYQNNLK